MKRGANLCLQKTVFFALFVGYVLFVVSFFIPKWYKFTKRETGQHYNYGIFMACIMDTDGGSRCQYTHFDNVEGGTVVTMKALASIGIIFYTAAMATGFLALCWIKERRQRLFYASVGTSIIAGISIVIVVAVYKSQQPYSNGSDDIAFYLAAASIAPLFYGAVIGLLVARTMVFVDEKEDEEKMHQKRKERRKKRRQREPVFMFPPSGTMIEDFKKKPITGIVVTSEDFQRSPGEDPFYFQPLTINNDMYGSKTQDRDMEEISEQYDIYPNVDEKEASLNNVNVHNPSSNLSSECPRPFTPKDYEEEISSEPWDEDQNDHPKPKARGVIKSHIFSPIKIPDLLRKTRAFKNSQKASKQKKKKTGHSNSVFSTEENAPSRVDVQGQSLHAHKFEDLPAVEK
ncbi:uncharacterized protein LOC125645747 [Ostrea edulis]|uniref:uncharacterized protein LOC125645747 n=1 Tax=Ostrea edulis TaxID=37623 RepID=UPI0020951976|nr:uncharacterized protein LOC125645747 [Ostrea edulis]